MLSKEIIERILIEYQSLPAALRECERLAREDERRIVAEAVGRVIPGVAIGVLGDGTVKVYVGIEPAEVERREVERLVRAQVWDEAMGIATETKLAGDKEGERP